MKRIIISLVIIIMIFVVGILFKDILVLDSFSSSEGRMKTKDGSSANYTIFTDSETGVQYLWITGYYKGGLTVMVDKDGKPLIDKGDEE